MQTRYLLIQSIELEYRNPHVGGVYLGTAPEVPKMYRSNHIHLITTLGFINLGYLVFGSTKTCDTGQDVLAIGNLWESTHRKIEIL